MLVVDEIVFGELFSGDVCVDVLEADMFLLSVIEDVISSQEVTINELQPGQLIDIYTNDGKDDGCLSADVVLVSAGLIQAKKCVF